jgi:hypothetical protein
LRSDIGHFSPAADSWNRRIKCLQYSLK